MNIQAARFRAAVGGAFLLAILAACAAGGYYDNGYYGGVDVGYAGGFYEPYGYDYGGWGGRYHVGPPRGGGWHGGGGHPGQVGHPGGGGGRPAPSIPGRPRGR
jgi:hypothetical protein